MWELHKWDWRVRSKKKVTALQRLRAALNLHTLMLLAANERAVPERALVICVSMTEHFPCSSDKQCEAVQGSSQSKHKLRAKHKVASNVSLSGNHEQHSNFPMTSYNTNHEVEWQHFQSLETIWWKKLKIGTRELTINQIQNLWFDLKWTQNKN